AREQRPLRVGRGGSERGEDVVVDEDRVADLASILHRAADHLERDSVDAAPADRILRLEGDAAPDPVVETDAPEGREQPEDRLAGPPERRRDEEPSGDAGALGRGAA